MSGWAWFFDMACRFLMLTGAAHLIGIWAGSLNAGMAAAGILFLMDTWVHKPSRRKS